MNNHIQIKIVPIPTMLKTPHLSSSLNHAILFITTHPNYYQFGCTPFKIIHIKDSDGTDITRCMVKNIVRWLSSLDGIDTLYVCCDAGLCRSPAMAKFICDVLNRPDESRYISENYPFLNTNVYQSLYNQWLSLY